MDRLVWIFFFFLHKDDRDTDTQTVQAASTYRPAITADPMTSFSAPPFHPLPPRCSLFIIYRCVLLLWFQHTSSAASFTADQSFAFISIFPKITCQLWQQGASFVLDLPHQKDKNQKKKNQCVPTTLSLMWLYIDNGYLFSFLSSFIMFWRRCSPP